MELELTPLSADFVAVARGLDVAQPLTPEALAALRAALDRYAVVVFHDQPLSKAQLVDFARQFGPVDRSLQRQMLNRVQDRLQDEAISDISNLDVTGGVAAPSHKQSVMNVGNRFWHTDSAYADRPFRYSVLAAQQAVSWGGQTEYADLRAAYDALDARTRALIEGRTATFYSHLVRQWLGIEDGPQELSTYPPVRWPLVRTHPGSGRKLLWCDTKVCEISGMSLPEGRALAQELVEHITQRDRVYAHGWRPNDLVIYDNRAVLHRGRRFDLSEPREMRRVSTLDDETSLGEAPFAVVTPVTVSESR
jgi:alpha-ketoglutarate-dependent 2,4-dichlorophenoxyacetate dioxygenase